MNNMTLRAISGIIYIAVLCFGILINVQASFGLFLALALIAFSEYAKNGKETLQLKTNLFSYLSVIALFIGINGTYIGLSEQTGQTILFTSFFTVTGTFLYELFTQFEKGAKNIVFQMGGLIYAALPFCFALPFAHITGDYNGMILISLFILIWSSDTFAYLCGRTFGKHKLFEKISPKKTWEGFIGGAILTVGSGIILFYYTEITHLTNWIVFALLAVVFGSIGDLVESMFKRSIGIKDSGNLIPGHGGILDRMDSFMVALPVIYAFFSIFGL